MYFESPNIAKPRTVSRNFMKALPISFFLLIILFPFIITSCKNEVKIQTTAVKKIGVKSVSKKSNKDYQKTRKTVNILGNAKEVTCIDYQQFVSDDLLDNYITKMNYRFDEKGNILEEVCILTNNEFNYKYLYYFDQMNNALVTICLDKNDKQKFIKKDSLNKEGMFVSNIIEEKEITRFFSRNYLKISDTVVIFSSTSKVFQNKKLVKHDEWKTEVNKFRNGNLIETSELIKDKQEVTERFKYDERNNMVEKKDFLSNSFTLIKYDSENRKIYFFSENPRYKIKNEYFWKYDNFGNIVEQTYVDKGVLNPRGTYKCEYIYDEQNNWIVKKIFKPNGEKISITTRKINYY